MIGAYFGAPQLGMAIGGLIGGAVDPTKINGPHIGDGQQQQATDGAPIAWVMGTATVAGTVCQVGTRREVKVKDSGGKGGPKVSHYEARQDFAILVCESSELRNSTISSVLMVEQDGKIVYDVRPGSAMTADSAKWKRNVDFMYGGESQMPHPTLEAISGVGNTPAYRGSLLAVFKDFNLTQAGDRIPSFRFLVQGGMTRGIPAQSTWRYIAGLPNTSTDDYSTVDFDDSAWAAGRAPFGDLSGNRGYVGANAHAFYSGFSPTIATVTPKAKTLWLRGDVYIHGDAPLSFYGWFDNKFWLYINGRLVRSGSGGSGYGGSSVQLTNTDFNPGHNLIAVRCQDNDDDFTDPANDAAYFDFALVGSASIPTLDALTAAISARGGLVPSDIDVSALAGTQVIGYPIAKQCTAVDALVPLLQAYFARGSEYDGKLHFDFYGGNASIVVDDADLLEGNDANDGAVTANLRNNATEFPLRMIGSYYDPAQNYMPVQVMDVRRAADVIAIGDSKLDIPVVMDANSAQQAVNKAMKVAYATLEGTLEYSVPFAGKTQKYLSLCAGEPLNFRGKRWVLDEAILSQGYLKLTTRYDRQSAYTSNVQAIQGLPPAPPQSRYSGPTTIIPMNLPSLRPQDTSGVYLAVASSDGRASWRGCDVQVSYDGKQSWQSAMQVAAASVFGALTAADAGSSLTAQVNGDLVSVTTAQLDARANGFALVHDDTHTEVAQFGTATEDPVTAHKYALTVLRRGLSGTTQLSGVAGDKFVLLDNAAFLPIDLAFAGKTLYFRAVGFGEVAEDAAVVALVYTPDTTTVHDGGTVT